IVPPAQALELARQVGRNPDLLYVDCNAVSPATVRRVEDLIGERFVDAGIIGAPGNPRFYASGRHAGEVAALPLDVRVLPGDVGAASALKMCYAILTKGLTALAAEQLLAAERLGLTEPLLAELEDRHPDLRAWGERAVPAMFPKAYRWIAEMEE